MPPLTPRTASKRSASWFLSLEKTRNSSAKISLSFSRRLLPRTARTGWAEVGIKCSTRASCKASLGSSPKWCPHSTISSRRSVAPYTSASATLRISPSLHPSLRAIAIFARMDSALIGRVKESDTLQQEGRSSIKSVITSHRCHTTSSIVITAGAAHAGVACAGLESTSKLDLRPAKTSGEHSFCVYSFLS